MTDAAGLAELLRAVHARHAECREGAVATYIPELARADPECFGLAACLPDGTVVSVGDASTRFTIQSVSKPFLYGLALATHGQDAVHARAGVEPTGDAFDSLLSLDPSTHRPHNPLVNAGAIAVAAHVPGADATARFSRVLQLFRDLSGRDDVHADMAVYLSERGASHRNRALAHLMRHFGVLAGDVEETLDLYVQQCALLVDVQDLAVMAATLAAGGRNPLTGVSVFTPDVAERVRAVMLTCGMYDAAGRFAFEVGLPAKSGVGGGILAAAEGTLGLAAYAPRLDAQGHSVRGLRSLRDLADALHLHVFDPTHARLRPVARLGPAVEAPVAAARATTGGAVAAYIPELAAADPERLAVALCAVDGSEDARGDADTPFTLQAVAHAFAYALALDAHGVAAVHERVGLEPSGNPFHAIVLSPHTGRPFNPLVNAGALAVAGLHGGGADLLTGLAAFAGERTLPVDEAVFASEQAAAHRNRAIAHLLRHFGVLDDVEAALARYLRQCSVAVTCRQLARMGATLAAGGVCPRTGVRALSAQHVKHVLALMATCGMHEASGRFAFEVGLPAKSGISGAIVAVAPGRYGAAVFSPPVDAQGNSVRGVAALRALTAALRPA